MLIERNAIKCFNFSDGAKIQGTIFLDPDLPVCVDIVNMGISRPSLGDLFERKFDTIYNGHDLIKSNFFDNYHRLEKLTLMLIDVMRGVNDPDNQLALYQVFSAQYSILNQAKENPDLIVAYRFVDWYVLLYSNHHYEFCLRDPGCR